MRRASLTALMLAGTAGGAFAQAALSPSGLPVAPNGSSLTATLSERFEVNDNYNLDDPSPGTSYFADTRLAVDYLKQTDTQSFTLGFDTACARCGKRRRTSISCSPRRARPMSAMSTNGRTASSTPPSPIASARSTTRSTPR